MNPVLTSLLRHVLAGAVQRARSEAGSSSATTQRTCDVAIVFATAGECGGLEDRLDGLLSVKADKLTIKQGGLNGRHIVLAAGGVGQTAARKTAEQLIAGHAPAWVISAGFAGGLSDALARGDFLLANQIIDLHGRRLDVDISYDQPPSAAAPHVHVGRLLTVDRVICRPAEKLRLGHEHQALAVDMETLAVADVCRQTKTRFLSVRIISDDVNEALPEEINRLIGSAHPAHRMGAALGAVWNRPTAVKDLWKLREHTVSDADRLAEFLLGVVEQLMPESESGEAAAAG